MTRDCASPPRGCPRVGTPDTEAVGRLLDATRRPLQPRDGVVATRLFPKRMNVHQQNAAKLAELDVRTRQVYQASDTVELCKDAPPWVKADAAVWRARGGGLNRRLFTAPSVNRRTSCSATSSSRMTARRGFLSLSDSLPPSPSPLRPRPRLSLSLLLPASLPLRSLPPSLSLLPSLPLPSPSPPSLCLPARSLRAELPPEPRRRRASSSSCPGHVHDMSETCPIGGQAPRAAAQRAGDAAAQRDRLRRRGGAAAAGRAPARQREPRRRDRFRLLVPAPLRRPHHIPSRTRP